MTKLKPCYLSDGTAKTGKRIIDELMKIEGVNETGYDGYCIGAYYYVEDNYICMDIIRPKGYVLIELPEETKQLTFPRWMKVWMDDERLAVKCYVISNINNLFQVVHYGYEEDFDNGKDFKSTQFKHAKEVEQPTETIEERIINIEKFLKLK